MPTDPADPIEPLGPPWPDAIVIPRGLRDRPYDALPPAFRRRIDEYRASLEAAPPA